MERTLLEVLMDLPDFRQAGGKRHVLAKVIIFVVVALLCGQNSLQGIARWGQHLDYETRRRLGNRHGKTPSYGTIWRVLHGLQAPVLAEALQHWIETALAIGPREEAWLGLALDGKTLRGSSDDAADQPALKVLNAFVQELGVVLTSQLIPTSTNELGAMPAFLADLLLTGRVVTDDALHTHRDQAELILEKGGTMCCG